MCDTSRTSVSLSLMNPSSSFLLQIVVISVDEGQQCVYSHVYNSVRPLSLFGAALVPVVFGLHFPMIPVTLPVQ